MLLADTLEEVCQARPRAGSIRQLTQTVPGAVSAQSRRFVSVCRLHERMKPLLRGVTHSFIQEAVGSPLGRHCVSETDIPALLMLTASANRH